MNDEDLAAGIYANHELRWKAARERMNRSIGQKVRFAIEEARQAANAARIEILTRQVQHLGVAHIKRPQRRPAIAARPAAHRLFTTEELAEWMAL